MHQFIAAMYALIAVHCKITVNVMEIFLSSVVVQSCAAFLLSGCAFSLLLAAQKLWEIVVYCLWHV